MVRKGLKRHALSACLPEMSQEVKATFLEDVRKHGVREPVVLYEGRVLDGWHRYGAAARLEIDCEIVEYDGDDPVGFVISNNVERRHMTPAERAQAVLRLRGFKLRSGEVVGAGEMTTSQLAREAQVGARTMERERARIAGPAQPAEKPASKPPADSAPAPEAARPPMETPALAEPPSLPRERPPMETPALDAGPADMHGGKRSIGDLEREVERLTEDVERLEKENRFLADQYKDSKESAWVKELGDLRAELAMQRQRTMEWEAKYANCVGQLAGVRKALNAAKREARRAAVA